MMRLAILLLILVGWRAGIAGAMPPVPPVLVQREAVRWPEAPAGTTTAIDVGTSTTFTLFVPAAYAAPAGGAQRLVVHFHGASWWVIQEHTARGSTLPLLACNARGDRDFDADLARPGVFRRALDGVARELIAAGAPPSTRVAALDVSSFSGGYAGVMALLRSAEFEPMVARLMLQDSMYVRDAADSTPQDRRPNPEALAPLVAYARKAVAGERTLLFEHSSTPSLRSVGPRDCSRFVIAELGLTIVESVPGGAPTPTADEPFPLLWRSDAGRAHFWCYMGETSAIHLAHLRNQAAMWGALDAAGAGASVAPALLH